MKSAGIVAISDDGKPVLDSGIMRRAMEYAADFGLPIVDHCEDCCGAHIHIAHISTARSVELVRQAKARGLRVTCEVTPHHFTLSDKNVFESSYDTNFKMAPPLRSQADVEAILEGLRDGTIDAIATDHAPHHANEKMYEFDKAPNGITGLETAVSLTLDRLLHGGVISLTRMVELLACNPAKIFKLNRGTLKVGAVADVTIFNPEKQIRVDASKSQSKSRNTPFNGWELKGAPVAVIVGGRIVHESVARA
jgi:dihydroorotase